MNPQRKLISAGTAPPVLRLRTVAVAALLALAACVTVFILALPSFAQARPSSPEATATPPPPVYVDKDATGGADNGTSWEDAYLTVQDALDNIISGEIWVAEGVYYPDEGVDQINGDRMAAFQLKQGVALYGGFDPSVGDVEWDDRDWVNNVTVLSGDIDQNDTTNTDGVVTDPDNIDGNNSYHVVTAEDVMFSAELDGFTITAGLADSDTEPHHQRGAGIYALEASPTLVNLVVRGNKAAVELLETSEGYGGGMFNDSGSPDFDNVTFRNNFALVSGGGLYTTNSDGDIPGVVFEGNDAGVSGGGMYLFTSVGQTLSALAFTGNSAGESGGGLYAQSGGHSSLGGNSSFTSNTAGSGGGLYIYSSDLSLSSVTFTSNGASEVGGGMFAQLGTYSLSNVTFDSNTAGTAGGGLYADRNIGTVGSSNFWDNLSARGAGMYVTDPEYESAELTVNSTLFVDNTASQDGGGMCVVDSPEGTLNGVSFLYNEATTVGGGMVLIDSEAYSLSNSDFSGNQAESGGGMFVESSDPTLVGVTFAANHAALTSIDDSIGGGGIYLVGSSDATFSRCTFRENKAATGAGMYIDDSNPTLTNVSFVGNQAGDGVTGSGGGLWNDEGSPSLVDVLFGGNKATEYGGGMRTGGAGSNVTLTNLTFSGNAAGVSGGGVNTTSPNMYIHNTVSWNNQDSSGTGTAGASISGSGDLYIDHSLIQGQFPSGIGNLDGTNPSNDPLFVVPVDPATAPTTSGVLSVKFGSPIVDAGDNTAIAGITLDLAGNPRIYNSVVDMGAYELQLACPPLETTRLYVNTTASLGNTGTSWQDAFKNLQDAFTLAGSCESIDINEIWVAKGVYRPDDGVGMVPNGRSETYQLMDGVAVYGGFYGNETNLIDRNWVNNVTVLSGDVDGNDIASGGIVLHPANIRGYNSYHVVTATGTGNTAILDGFTITAGQANGDSVDQADRGGGMYNDASSPTQANLTFTGNYAGGDGGALANLSGSNTPMSNVQFKTNGAGSSGGGIYNDASSPNMLNLTFTGNYAGQGGALANANGSHPPMTDVQFMSNTAVSSGGAVYNQGSSPTLTNVLLSGNTASTGAGIYNDTSDPSLINVLLSGNSASNGAAIYNTAGSPVLVNVTVAGNRASSTAGGMFNTNTSQPAVRNCIFWDNRDSTGTGTASATIYSDGTSYAPLIDYSLVQSLSGITYTGNNNLDANPWFTTPLDPATAPSTAGDFTLWIFSHAIDVGDNAANSTLTDLAGNPRVIHDIIDLGPYEAPYVPVVNVCLPVVLRNYP